PWRSPWSSSSGTFETSCRACRSTASSPEPPGPTPSRPARRGAAPRCRAARSRTRRRRGGRTASAPAACGWTGARPIGSPGAARTRGSRSSSPVPERAAGWRTSQRTAATWAEGGRTQPPRPYPCRSAGRRLRQLTLGLNSRGLSLGYQRDLFSSGRRGHTYKLGYAAGRGGLAAGFATALYRGGTSGTGWDVGILYDWTPALSIGGVLQNIGQPVVRDSTLRLTYVPSATLQLAGRQVVLSALSRLTSDRSEERRVGKARDERT